MTPSTSFKSFINKYCKMGTPKIIYIYCKTERESVNTFKDEEATK